VSNVQFLKTSSPRSHPATSQRPEIDSYHFDNKSTLFPSDPWGFGVRPRWII